MPGSSLLVGLLTLPYISLIAAEYVGADFDTKDTQAFEHDFDSYS
jgi:hypothetical protein